MSTIELLKKVRKIEIKTKGLSNHIFSGEYHTAFKGKGMAFSEVREYQPGDDVRSIDWNVTARYNSPFVKVFEEEREMTVILLIDVSGSSDFGTQTQLKREIATEIAAVLSFSAINNNDKIGVIFFSDKIEMFIPPKKGKSHILRIIRQLITFESESKKTNIEIVLKYFNNVIKKRAVCFIFSDFMDDNFEKSLKIARNKHDIIALRIHDEREEILPNVGLLKVEDSENREMRWIDSSNKKVRSDFNSNYREFEKGLKQTLQSSGVDHIDIKTGKDYVKPLMNFFKNRGRR
ncbi:MAG: DUF58 domain-containing protein [Flavobacteriales bacterium]|jgi:uncharacterized protein (DUF58 family)|nr:DUF58 domain-containing protein [Flavobacteriales bacterium]MBT6013938.1 DUF58 domain-containing protein [Flavobacteriales bacterium]MBT7481323.1 DUF58 domain-containing protein [Flavobacteriales bacterium]